MGGECMKDHRDLNYALHKVADDILRARKFEGTVTDANGNTVGHYRITEER
jgi:hypothetical protein